MEEKMQHVESFMGSNGLPSKASDIDAAFEHARTSIPNSTGQSHFAEVEQHASHGGLGNDFNVNSQPRQDVKEKLLRIEDQLIQQQEFLEKQSEIRKSEIEKKT
jgi:hypothetical protein